MPADYLIASTFRARTLLDIVLKLGKLSEVNAASMFSTT